MQVQDLVIYCDSQLVVGQLSGEYQLKDERMRAYADLAIELIRSFDHALIQQIGREHNAHADALAGLASACKASGQRSVSFSTLSQPSYKTEYPQVLNVDFGPSWMDEIVSYLRDDILPAEKKDAFRVKNKAAHFWLSPSGTLYRRSFTGPYLRCVHPAQVQAILEEVHEGSCGCHTGGRSLAHRLISQGYWWKTMQKDAVELVKKCRNCQLHAPIIHQPAYDLNPIRSPWPFAQWGLDIIGKLPKAPGGFMFLITATDYFTKWVEAKALVTITEADVKSFVWKYIITRFGVPYAIVSDNGTQFVGKELTNLCAEYGIRFYQSTPAYPQCNGQAEATNKTVAAGIKKRLEEKLGCWAEELHHVLWAYRTTPRRSTGQTPFSLAFGMEAVIPLEGGIPTLRSEVFEYEANAEAVAADLDLAEEKRDKARIQLANYQQEIAKTYNRNVRLRSFKEGDLVLRKVVEKKKKTKFKPNYEGPYRVVKAVADGSYKLEELNGTAVKNPWNAMNLRKFYG